ncbi:histidinol-phosphate transaminase [Aureisphaera sp. CAU 1614]|uniref:Histidinol-phosphate aminotransferase n=1 Tax=Halomarinibacterium sedimenti TaxID=2857106 RepID=A0A9X1FPX4_9FLAO|nr:histidinol-phosphate transaminase [Halomarinibacterium sedimenti]MBW2938471.1 histidinol-phosphate transaminase [Halomarinibacterium sedimenti]
MNQLIRKNIQALQPYSSARDEFSGEEGVFLDANENPFGAYNRYPDPYQNQLKEEVSKIKKIPIENIFVGNGSDEAIDLLFRIFCNPGKDKALTFTPTYGMYKVSAAINDVELLEIPLNQSFEIDQLALKNSLVDPFLKLIFICSPNNPTGNSIPLKTVQIILENFNGIVVVDEAYIDFTKEKSSLTILDKYANLVVLQTLSKAWGQAGLRIGFAFANDQIIHYLNKIKPPYNISEVNQQLAVKALKNKSFYENNKAEILSEKDKIKVALSKIKGIFRIFPSETNFLLIQIENADDVYTKLKSEKIIVRNRSSQIKNALRITIGSPSENKKLIESLQKITQ